MTSEYNFCGPEIFPLFLIFFFLDVNCFGAGFLKNYKLIWCGLKKKKNTF